MINLIIEDGSGIQNANSYIDEAFADEYAESLGSDVWENNASKHKIALINASRFIDMRYRARLYGDKLNSDQGLAFPREEQGLNQSLKLATAHAALMFIREGGLDLNANASNSIRRQSVGVGSGAVQETVEYFYPNPENVFSVIDAFMDDVLGQSSANIRQFPVFRG